MTQKLASVSRPSYIESSKVEVNKENFPSFAQNLNIYADIKLKQDNYQKSNSKLINSSQKPAYKKKHDLLQQERQKKVHRISRNLNTSLKDFFFQNNDQSDVENSILDESGLLTYLS